ncbi:MAG: hypothetical protein ACPG7U_05190 [Holosporaceae bacterium]
MNAVLNASMPPAKDSLYQAVPLALESKARQCFGSQESGICSIPSGDEDSLSLLSEDRQSLASTGSQLSFASEVTEEWYHCDVGGDLYPLGLEENIALEAQGMRRFKSQDSGLGSMEFGSDDISTLSKEERSLALTDHFPQATPVKEKAWKKYLSAMSDRVARNKERAFKYRQQAVDKSNQWRFWDRVAMADQQNVRAAREKAIDRELDRLAGCDVKAATQDETALTFLIADVMRDKTKQASKPLGKTKLFQVAEGQFKRWEGCRAHVKTSLKLIDEKNADLLRQDISTQRIAEGLLDRLKKDNSNSTHVRAALGALSERKTVKRCIITWLKQQCADLDLDQKSDGRDKRSLKDFIDRLSDDTTLGWKYKSKAYDILGEDDCPHYTVRLTRIENGVLVTEL